jgi:tRNA A37 threonylcarbamoyladenosine synthetase subunit TsaC/SUA5/YrdC
MQTDTTVGFSSQNEAKLAEIKSRQSTKPFIKLYQNFKTLLADGIRVPNSQKNRIRRSKKTTFIVKSQSFRVAPTQYDSNILRFLSWSYSTSANEAGKNFQRDFCEKNADIIIEDKNSLFEGRASTLYKVNAIKIKRLR